MKTPSKIDELVRTQFLMGLVHVLIAIRTYEAWSPKLDVNTDILVDEINQAIDDHKRNYETMRRAIKAAYAPLDQSAFNDETRSLYEHALAITGMTQAVFKSYDFA